MKKDFQLGLIESCIFAQGIRVRFCYAGDKEALITFYDKNKKLSLIKECFDMFELWFSFISSYVPCLTPKKKLI